ncbi:hypothetical protein P43SY_009981 [Pythium insidiosum]|uniref:Uncharacterized protein n=1 Tax=Pythium insidiosum TaxID=114742 RepID=A0AAD5L810_PYTIN|nr:hypothetical protein P43SY_009981 [Pythium insidiosum]
MNEIRVVESHFPEVQVVIFHVLKYPKTISRKEGFGEISQEDRKIHRRPIKYQGNRVGALADDEYDEEMQNVLHVTSHFAASKIGHEYAVALTKFENVYTYSNDPRKTEAVLSFTTTGCETVRIASDLADVDDDDEFDNIRMRKRRSYLTLIKKSPITNTSGDAIREHSQSQSQERASHAN